MWREGYRHAWPDSGSLTRGSPGRQDRSGIAGRWNSICKDSKTSNSIFKTRALEKERLRRQDGLGDRRPGVDSPCHPQGHSGGRVLRRKVTGSHSCLKLHSHSRLQGLHNFSFSSRAFIPPQNSRASTFPYFYST